MLPDRSKYTEAAHVGEEFFHDKAYELERQCMVVHSAVQRKILSFPEALEAYSVTKEQFGNYLVKNIRQDVFTTLSKDGVVDVDMYLDILKKLFHEVLDDSHAKKAAPVDKAIDKLSTEMKAEGYYKLVAG
ncbi:hypothetical protein [Mucilaginibacter dorajii]|uniref:Uncharacterized protein n=1 Tax=Mucilaginibacter dorajii TaxID=692994 RepID=A0ABP7PKQ1_9SPHI|nr:hypothetical protein [Mucilaginibacter dorajii]MCS3733591.1 hypothetical protein [Mucilaginibacter dorajii]